MVGHFGDEVRLIDELDAALFERGEGGADVGDVEVKDGAAVRAGLLGRGEHEADVAAFEEGEGVGVDSRAGRAVSRSCIVLY